MKEQKITIEIDHQGKLTADAEGFEGDACLSELDKVLEGIAGTRQTIERKPDEQHVAKARQRKISLGKKQ